MTLEEWRIAHGIDPITSDPNGVLNAIEADPAILTLELLAYLYARDAGAQ
jgi:hypothetical protein